MHYLVEELLNVGFQRGAGLDDELLGEHVRVLALRLERLHDVDEDDVEQLVGDEVGLRDERREDVEHETLHLAGVLVAERERDLSWGSCSSLHIAHSSYTSGVGRHSSHTIHDNIIPRSSLLQFSESVKSFKKKTRLE